MDTRTKLLALFLALMLCLSLLPAAALASGEAGEALPAAEGPAEEAAEEAPAEDGMVYFETAADLDKTGEPGWHAVVARPWAYAYAQDVAITDGAAELRVVVDANRENVVCEWYRVSYEMRMNDYGFWNFENVNNLIEGETGLTLTVSEPASYICRISSTAAEGSAENEPAMDDTLDVTFYAEYELGEYLPLVSALPVGENTNRTNVDAAAGQPVTLEATVSVNSETVDRNSLRYRWHDDNGYIIEGADGPALTVEEPETASYTLEVLYDYYYTSPDGKFSGWEPGEAIAVFDVNVSDESFGLSLSHNAKVVEYEYVRDDTLFVGLRSDLGDPVALRAIVSEENEDAVTWYQWSAWDGFVNINSYEYVVKNLFGRMEMSFSAGFGGQRYDIDVVVAPMNLRDVWPAGAEKGDREIDIPAEVDGRYDLSVMLDAVRPEEVSYWWGYESPSGPQFLNYTPTGKITVAHLSESVTYFCDVYDGYGDRVRLYFHLNVGDAPDQPDPYDADGDGAVTAADAAAFLQRGDGAAQAANLLRKLVGLGDADARAAAEALIDHDVSELYAAIGMPLTASYEESCLAVGGFDGLLVYDGFVVQTIVKPTGSETVYDVYDPAEPV